MNTLKEIELSLEDQIDILKQENDILHARIEELEAFLAEIGSRVDWLL